MPSNLGLERNEALLAENKRLRQEILELKRQHVYKSGLLKRRRETMLTFGSGVWQPRYFEVRLGNLLCFKSMLDRAKRFELPLVDMGTKQQVALTKGSDSSENYIITIVLRHPGACQMVAHLLFALCSWLQKQRKNEMIG